LIFVFSLTPLGTVEKVVLECPTGRFLNWFGNWISRTNSVREFQFPHEQDGFSTRPLTYHLSPKKKKSQPPKGKLGIGFFVLNPNLTLEGFNSSKGRTEWLTPDENTALGFKTWQVS